jgi:hypothetical protein
LSQVAEHYRAAQALDNLVGNADAIIGSLPPPKTPLGGKRLTVAAWEVVVRR